MNKKNIKKIAEIRIAVALLGETNKWWQTGFFSEASEAFLDYIFPRSKKVNQVIACDTVQKITDQKVGANHFHLFRLNIKYEELIHKILQNDDLLINNETDALKVLERISNGLSVENSPGPKNIGSMDDLDENILEAFAAEYLKAFKMNYESYPYLN